MKHSTVLAALAVLTASGAAAQAGGLPAAPDAWISEVQGDHPLVGLLWNVPESREAQPRELAEAAASASYVLLGETHDNPDHHRLQAWIVEAMLTQDSRPALVFEMIREDQAAALQAHLAESPGDAEGLGPAVEWEERGWPDWSMYKPIAEAAMAAGLAIHAGDVARREQEAAARQGFEALDESKVSRLALDRALPEGQHEALEEQLMAAHCDMIPEEAIPAMVRVQRLRDAAMADALIDAATNAETGQAVLIAGREHVRADRGVPWYLRARIDSPDVLSVGLMQVSEGLDSIEDYLPDIEAAQAAYDYLWFTPRPHDRDPCEEMRRQMEEHQRQRDEG